MKHTHKQNLTLLSMQMNSKFKKLSKKRNINKEGGEEYTWSLQLNTTIQKTIQYNTGTNHNTNSTENNLDKDS